MRLKKLILLLVTLLLLPGTALANPQEQFILNQVVVGHFDVWQHTNGTWQDTDRDGKADPYGQTGKKVTETYTYPQSQYANQFTPTRVEIMKITQASSLTDEELRNAGRSETWDKFYKDYLTKLPNNYFAAKTSENMAQGTVTVEKTFDLMPELLDLKDPTVRAELGMTDRDFSDMAQGWRWYTPVLIKWYGVPKAAAADLDLAVTVLDPGVPTGEKAAQPGQQYTGTVVYENLSGATMTKPAAVKVTHQGYETTLKDQAGNTVNTLTLAPGESKTLTFTWHGAIDTNTSTIKATINLPPDAALPEINLINNEKTITVPVKLPNLKVEIINFPESAKPGDPVSVGARITNQTGEMTVTRIVIKINGKVVSDKTNFDVISQQDAAANFTMPNKDATVEFIVNPDKNKPAYESNWNDNTATCTIIKEDPIPVRPGEIKVKINAPNRIDAFNAGNWNFSVNVKGYFPPPPPMSDESGTATVTLRVTGSSIIVYAYHLSSGLYGDVIVDEQQPVKFDKTISFDVTRGTEFDVTKNFTFPWSSGFPGQDYPIPLHAKASWRSYSGEDATKVLTFREKIDPSVHLTR